VEEQTKGRIKDLILQGMIKTDTRLVLTNAVYFKGEWVRRFPAENTQTEEFKTLQGWMVKVPLMHQKDRFPYSENENLQILEMPYEGEIFSMLIILPRKGQLETVEKSLSVENLNRWQKEMHPEEVKVHLPKFRTEGRCSLKGELQKMGLNLAFRRGEADFSGMTGARDLCLDEVVHKSFVEVDEKGTEAAAATGMMMRSTALRKEKVFRADRPFLYLIQDRESGGILFMGRMANPS